MYNYYWNVIIISPLYIDLLVKKAQKNWRTKLQTSRGDASWTVCIAIQWQQVSVVEKLKPVICNFMDHGKKRFNTTIVLQYVVPCNEIKKKNMYWYHSVGVLCLNSLGLYLEHWASTVSCCWVIISGKISLLPISLLKK